MKITLLSEDSIRLTGTPGAMTIEAESADQMFSPFHMLGASMATCTFAVLSSWASNFDIESDDLVIDVSWTFADKPHRVGDIVLRLTWPTLPAERMERARRAATLCTVHATLQHPPTIRIDGALE